MKTKFMKGVVLCLTTVMTFCGCFVGKVEAKEWDVTPSQTNYSVEFDNSAAVFLCNQSTVGHKVGAEYYMTYTVESAELETVGANGVLATNQPSARYPYVTSADGVSGGLMNHNLMNQLFIEGNTYFVKFTITKDGYKYRIGSALSGEGHYLKFTNQAGEVKSDSEYFGVWLGHIGMKGKLTRVRMYDKHGNDLGLQATPGRNVTIGREMTLKKDTEVNHTYTVEMENANLVAIRTKRMATGDKVYMEYKVKSSESKLSQWGGILGTAITGRYPYLTGYMRHQNVNVGEESNEPLLVKGAEYILVFEKKLDRVDLVVQRTLNGKTTSFVPSAYYGVYEDNMKHYALWLAAPSEESITAVLEDFKCYDSNKNNLGVQCDVTGVTVTHHGELEDYAGCEALYASENDTALFGLYADKRLVVTENRKIKEGTYAVEGGIMTTKIDNKETEYEYTYQFFKDKDGKIYRRVGTCKVIFDTGKGSAVETQVLNEKNGYQVIRPDNPTLEGNTFEGWYTLDGEEFEFEQLVTKSITLYAKWSDTEWVDGMAKTSIMPYVFAAGAVLIVIAAGVCGGIIIRKGNKNGKKEQEEK